jgi:iron complex outermembrane receptor protein
LLSFSGAGRIDQYSDFGTTTTPQAALELHPLASLLLRSSYSESFRAPTLSALFSARRLSTANVIDPAKGNITVVIPSTLGGNPNLKPETGKSYSFGAVWSGDEIPNLQASATFWHLEENDRLSQIDQQTLLTNPTLFPGHIVRDAAGNLVSIDVSPVNFGALIAEGVDLDGRYTLNTAYGDFTPELSMTITTKFMAALQPGQPLIDRLGAATASDAWAPQYKATARLGWNFGPYSASFAGRYLGSYLDYQTPINTNQLGDYWLWDVSAKIDVGSMMNWQDAPLSHTDLSVSVINLLDRGPQYSNYNFGSIGYDPQEFDMLGRYVSVSLAVHW